MSMITNFADTYKCPGCAGNLFVDETGKKLVCKFCGSDYDPNLFEMLDAFKRLEEVPDDAAADDARHEIYCSSCGAVVITDENTSSSICCFCGSPALAARRLTKEFRPDFILPFKVDKPKAKELFLDWADNNKYIPNDFTSEDNINKLTGLYVPFWLVDCKCDANFFGTGYINQGKDRAMFSLERDLTFYLSRVPFDGSRKISDRLMRAVEPFDYSELKEYRDAYLPGFFAERYDQTPLELSNNVINRMRNYAEETVKTLTSKKYDKVSFTTGGSKVSDIRYSYALLPVWFMNYQFEGVNYGFAINGQTGEVCGDLPFDRNKRKLALGKTIFLNLILPLVIVLAALIGTLIFTAHFGGRMTVDYLSTIVSIAPYLLGFGGLFIVARFLRIYRHVAEVTQNPIDPPPNVEQYYDSSKKTEVREDDKFISVAPRESETSEEKLMRKIWESQSK